VPVVSHADSRRTETPNAVMTTHASATQGGSSIALWRVEMNPGVTGPLHTFDVDQVWTVLDGGAEVELGADQVRAGRGDTIVMPAGVDRQIHSDDEAGLTAVVAAPAGARATPDGGEPVVPAWIR